MMIDVVLLLQILEINAFYFGKERKDYVYPEI